MKAAVVQVSGDEDEVAAETERLLSGSGAELAVLPERPVEGVPRHGGQFMERLLETSRKLDATLVGPVFARNDRLVAPVYRRGEVLGEQEKLHLYRKEKGSYEPGRDPEVVETPVGRVGVAVCYDATFPEYVRRLCVAGADAVAVPAMVSREGLRNWETYLRARALENKVPVLAANDPGAGGGRVIGFEPGERNPSVMRESVARSGVATGDVDMEWCRELRKDRLSENRLITHADAVR